MASSLELPSSFYCTQPIDFSKPLDTDSLKEKSVIVTGGANGIGLASARAFAEAGAYVTILDINEENGQRAASELGERGLHVQFVKTDTTSFSSQVAGFKAALSFSPSKTVDIVLANAGVAGSNLKAWLENAAKSTSDDPEPPSTLCLDVNLTGVYYTAHLSFFYFKHNLRKEDTAGPVSKQLIFVSSLAGYIGLSNVGEYGASKFGVRGLWKAVRHSGALLGPSVRYRSNLIAPTFIRTNMTAGIDSALEKRGIKLGTVDDVVAGVMRAACDEEVSGRAIA
ncbi:NAD(P)-binding protein, partial [Westerdykella ornata]